jgi:hypothetical protein
MTDETHICYDIVVRYLIADNGFSISRFVWLMKESIRYIPSELTHIWEHVFKLQIHEAFNLTGLMYFETLISISEVWQYVLHTGYDYFIIALETA